MHTYTFICIYVCVLIFAYVFIYLIPKFLFYSKDLAAAEKRLSCYKARLPSFKACVSLCCGI